MAIGKPSLARNVNPMAAQDSRNLGHPDIAQFSLGLMRLAMKQIHHCLSGITVLVAAVAG
jgi:hypothetical protein